MYISLGLENRNNYKAKPVNTGVSYFRHSNNLQQDVFVRTSNLNFKGASTTTASWPLKKLSNMTDPYSGIIMLTNNQLIKAEKDLDKCKTAQQTVKVLSKYTKNMLPIERKMFNIFRSYSRHEPKSNFKICLKKMSNLAHKNLILEEFDVMDKLDKMSRKMNPETALEVRRRTTTYRDRILKNEPNDKFKRKEFISSFYEIKPKNNENESLEKIKQQLEYLPTSGTSENAFIVKYSDEAINRSHQEIAKRLLRPSVQSAEHIKPDSLNGKNSLNNFILTSSGRNSQRKNIPLSKFIEIYPNIPKNTQKYIEQVIDKIHNGELIGHEDYPYNVKKTLFKESNQLINLDLSSYKYSEIQAKILTKKNKILNFIQNKK